MAYTKKTWVSGETPLSAENMNHIEQGVADAHNDISSLNTKITSKIPYNSKPWGATIKVVKNLNTATFGIRGTITETLYSETTYELTLNEDIGIFAGSFVTNAGITGYVITDGTTLKITPHTTINSGTWIIASGILLPDLY